MRVVNDHAASARDFSVAVIAPETLMSAISFAL
jgi:hypothetical protein